MGRCSSPNRDSDRTRSTSSRFFRPIAEATLCIVWWECLREIAFVTAEDTRTALDAAGSFSADAPIVAGWVGAVLGCLWLRGVYRRNGSFLASQAARRSLFAVELALALFGFIVGILPFNTSLASAAIFTAASACIIGNVIILTTRLRCSEIRDIVTIGMACIAVYGLVCSPLLPLLSALFPLSAIAAIGALAIAGAFLPDWRSRSEIEEAAGKVSVAAEGYRAPTTLLFSLLAYGFVFGIASLLPNPPSITYVCAAAAAMLILVALFYGRRSNVELWSKLRGTVFPLLIIGLIFLQSGQTPTIAAGALITAQLLYFTFLAAICTDIVQLAAISPYPVITKALLWNGLGGIGGAVVAVALKDFRQLPEGEFSLIIIGIVALLSFATLWIGSDEQIRKNWGIRRKLSPKQFHDASVRSRCQTLANSHRLTPRETQMIIALAQGRRPAEIQEEEGVTIHTVRAHIQHAYAKLDIHSTSELQALIKTVPIEETSLDIEAEQTAITD